MPETTYQVMRPQRGQHEIRRNGVLIATVRTAKDAERVITDALASDLLTAHPERRIPRWS